MTSIGYAAFAQCWGLTSVTIGNNVTSIGDNAFQHCNRLASITIGNSVTSIGSYAFAYCSSLTSIEIPNSVTSIGDYAFSHCSGLTSITIGNGIKSIGNFAFEYCNELTDVYCYAKSFPKTANDAFESSNIENATLHVLTSWVNIYKKRTPWSGFGNILAIIPGDANGDGLVNVTDIVATVNFIMEKPSEGFNKNAADLNGDGVVNVTDIVMMVSIIMDGGNQ